MAYQTTLGWSLIASGVVTLVLGFLPGSDLFWGILLLLVGTTIFVVRHRDRLPT